MNQRQTAIDVTQRETLNLRSELQAVRMRLATTQLENRRLRRTATGSKQGRLLARTHADARQLVGWRFANYSIARRQALSYGMSERRWAWGVALLKLSKVLAEDAAYADDFEVDDLADALAAVDRAAAACERDGLARLILRLPKGRAQQPKR